MEQAVVVTGGSSGIGRATAERIVELGYRVLNLDQAPFDHPGITTCAVDLMNVDRVEEILTSLGAEFEIVGLVNNAGFAQTALLEDTDTALLERTFALNLVTAATCARVLVPAMKNRSYGRIVNVSSRSALGNELRTAYAASKGGLISMARVWALELGRFGITANAVAPGPIATELFERMNPEGTERRDKMTARIPVGRIGRPDDVARAVSFFLSADAGYVTGQTLYVCGGLSVGAHNI